MNKMYTLVIESNLQASPEYERCWNVESRINLSDNLERVEYIAHKVAMQNPGKTIHLTETIALFTSKAAPAVKRLVNKSGEVIPS